MSQKCKETQCGMFEAGGRFFVGCNYWADHAGIAMWRKWDANAVRADLKLLSENDMEVLRVFPLWPDFQPISRHTACGQNFMSNDADNSSRSLLQQSTVSVHWFSSDNAPSE